MSNGIKLNEQNYLGSATMHVDPKHSLKGCKSGISQKAMAPQKLPFGKDLCNIVDVDSEQVHKLKGYVINNSAYKTHDPSGGREHKSYEAEINKVNYQKGITSQKFKDFKQKYIGRKGDYLKTQVLEDLKKRIEDTTSLDELEALKSELETSYEVDVLKTGQGWFTHTFGIDTSSKKALDSMFEQQEKNLSDTSSKHSM